MIEYFSIFMEKIAVATSWLWVTTTRRRTFETALMVDHGHIERIYPHLVYTFPRFPTINELFSSNIVQKLHELETLRVPTHKRLLATCG